MKYRIKGGAVQKEVRDEEARGGLDGDGGETEGTALGMGAADGSEVGGVSVSSAVYRLQLSCLAFS